MDYIREYLKKRGLNLSEKKTVIRKCGESFEFGGFHFHTRGKDVDYLHTRPRDKSVERLMLAIDEHMKNNDFKRVKLLLGG